MLLFAVFIQSSCEELVERAYLLQVLKKGYRSKWVAVNSGIVVPYSIIGLDTVSATNSFFYDILFGIEGTIFSTILLFVACIVIYIIGSKRNIEPLDVYAGFEEENSKKSEPTAN